MKSVAVNPNLFLDQWELTFLLCWVRGTHPMLNETHVKKHHDGASSATIIEIS
jgi:hypothetical protein